MSFFNGHSNMILEMSLIFTLQLWLTSNLRKMTKDVKLNFHMSTLNFLLCSWLFEAWHHVNKPTMIRCGWAQYGLEQLFNSTFQFTAMEEHIHEDITFQGDTNWIKGSGWRNLIKKSGGNSSIKGRRENIPWWQCRGYYGRWFSTSCWNHHNQQKFDHFSSENFSSKKISSCHIANNNLRKYPFDMFIGEIRN